MLAFWFVLAGALLIGVALMAVPLRRLPVTTSMLYLGVGAVLAATGLMRADPFEHTRAIELASEIAVLISLFVAGLKLRLPLNDRRWWLPFRLAVPGMILTIALVALVGVYGLGLSWGLAILIGAILGPTDPVFASDVQVQHADDQDRLRFALTGEGGLNDGVAFPFVLLGLGLLGHHELGANGLRWLAIDVVWASASGLAIGAALGTGVARFVLYLRRARRKASGLDDFLAMGLIALSYGLALAAHGYGFLAVFAAGVALRRIERAGSGAETAEAAEDALREAGHEKAATDPEYAPTYLTAEALRFNEQLERIGELAIVLVVGSALVVADLPRAALWFVPLLFLVIRPLSVFASLAGARVGPVQKGLIGWFGIRGIGSVYYVTYAMGHGLEGADARLAVGLVFATVAGSAFAHGVSVTPLMDAYERARKRLGRRADAEAETRTKG